MINYIIPISYIIIYKNILQFIERDMNTIIVLIIKIKIVIILMFKFKYLKQTMKRDLELEMCRCT